MLRAARLAESRKLELRVVPLPEGTDPADLIEREGADALRSLVERSAPFIVFQVERILERTDTRTAEGRDRALAELRPVLAEQPRERAARGPLAAGRGPARSVREAPGVADRRVGASAVRGSRCGLRRRPAIDEVVRAEREFLVLCVSLPADGERMLVSIDPELLLTSEPLRRAARHLAGRLASPLADLPRDDEQLATTVADLVARAGSAGTVSVEELEHARLLLELGRVERAIRRARGAGSSGISDLAREREHDARADPRRRPGGWSARCDGVVRGPQPESYLAVRSPPGRRAAADQRDVDRASHPPAALSALPRTDQRPVVSRERLLGVRAEVAGGDRDVDAAIGSRVAGSQSSHATCSASRCRPVARTRSASAPLRRSPAAPAVAGLGAGSGRGARR